MKKFHSLTLLTACVLVACIAPVIAAPSVAANQAATFSQAQQPNPQQPNTSQRVRQQEQQQEQPQAAPQGQVFKGTMMLKSGEYLFQDDSSKTTYKLDHQTQLSKYNLDGKKVQILGTLDSSSKLIHITKIALTQNNSSR